MRVYIDSDATGKGFKRAMIDKLRLRYDVHDLRSNDETTYPHVALNLANAVRHNFNSRGILICGTGQGMAMMANKVRGIFAGCCADVAAAKSIAQKNNANVLTIGCETMTFRKAMLIANAFLDTPHEPRPNADLMRTLENEIRDH